jgi:hypothetical protein
VGHGSTDVLRRLRRELVEVAQHGNNREIEAVLEEIRIAREELAWRTTRHRLHRDFADSPSAPRIVDEL